MVCCPTPASVLSWFALVRTFERTGAGGGVKTVKVELAVCATPVFVTVTVEVPPTLGVKEKVMLVLLMVGLTTGLPFTLSVLIPLAKPVPVSVTFTFCVAIAGVGAVVMPVICGVGLETVSVCVFVLTCPLANTVTV